MTSCAHRRFYNSSDERNASAFVCYDSLYECYDLNFDKFMYDYYYEHDSYPESREEYLQNAYRDDSINNFDVLYTYYDLKPNDSIYNFEYLSKYSELDSVRNILFSIDADGNKNIPFVKIAANSDVYNIVRGAIDAHRLLPFPCWYTFYNSDTLVIEDNDSLFSYRDDEWNYTFNISVRKLRKVDYILNLYIQNPNNWDEDKQFFYINKEGWPVLYKDAARNLIYSLMGIRVYKREQKSYTHRIRIDSVPKGLLAPVEENLRKIAGKEAGSAHLVHNFLRYDRENGMSDYVTKRRLPSALKDNQALNEALSEILDSVEADYMYLYCITHE